MRDAVRLRRSAMSTRLPIGFLLFAAAAFVMLCALGFWQLQRHEEKQMHNMRLTSQQDGTAHALSPSRQWDTLDKEAWEHRKVRLRGALHPDREVYWFNHRKGLGAGYDIFTPLRLREGGWVVVNRGFIAVSRPPEHPHNAPAAAEREITLTGFLRLPSTRQRFWHWFYPQDDAAARLWIVRDLTAMAAWMEIAPVAPWFLHAETPVPLADDSPLPQPVAPPVGLAARSVNHIAYALTWFAMAAVLVVVAIAYCRRQAHIAPKEAGER